MTDSAPPRITALPPAQAARLLAAAGQRRITEAMVRADLEAGAPAHADGTLNLIHYVAWLAREAGNRAKETNPDLASSFKPHISTQERCDHGA